MANFTIFCDEDGEMKAWFRSTNGKWKCLCCDAEMTAELVSLMLAKHSANDDEYFDDRESA